MMKKQNIQPYLKYVILLTGIAMLVIGVMRGDMSAVLRKAAAVCLECCGIG